MQIIAHKIQDVESAKKALDSGVDFIEIDVSERFLFSKFTTQHDAVKGKFGIGKELKPLLVNGFNKKIYLDLKFPHYSVNFHDNFLLLLKESGAEKMRMGCFEWQFVYNFCQNHDHIPFYTLKTEKHKKGIKNFLAGFTKPVRLMARHTLIDEDFMMWFKSETPAKSIIWAWTVNDLKEAIRLKKLGVNGIITDEWRLLVRSEKLEM